MPKFPAKGLLDKLEIRLPREFPFTTLFQRARDAKLPISEKKLRDRKWYFRVGTEKVIYLKKPFNIEGATKVLIRPSEFSSFGELRLFMEQLIDPGILEDSRIERLDCTVDYDVGFDVLRTGFDLHFKRFGCSYESNGGQLTGMRIGKGSEVCVIYDKGEEQKLEKPLSRIEFQLKGAKLPVRHFKEILPFFASGGANFRPFRNIRVGSVHFISENQIVGGKRERLRKLKTLTLSKGMFGARRELGLQRNFERDYEGLFTYEHWEPSPDFIFSNSMKAFFS